MEPARLQKLQQAMARKRNKRSARCRKAVRRLAAEHSKIANRRKDFLHQSANKVVKQSALIATEELNVKNMTASGGVYKTGLNRSILDTAPSTFLTLLKSRAEEAGLQYVEVPTRQVTGQELAEAWSGGRIPVLKCETPAIPATPC